jgi:hypothetical protein
MQPAPTTAHGRTLNPRRIVGALLTTLLLTACTAAPSNITTPGTGVCTPLRTVAEWEDDSRSERSLWASIASSPLSIAKKQ